MATLRDIRHMAEVLEHELGYYRSLFVLMDRQRDRLKIGAGHDLPDDFAAIRKVQKRIEASRKLIAHAQSERPDAVRGWVETPQISNLLTRITDLATHCHEAVAECEQMARDKIEEYRVELERMGQGRRLLASIGKAAREPRFIDQRP